MSAMTPKQMFSAKAKLSIIITDSDDVEIDRITPESTTTHESPELQQFLDARQRLIESILPQYTKI